MPRDVAVVTPVLDDWESLLRLLPVLDEEFAGAGIRAAVFAVDDGSATPAPPELLAWRGTAVHEVKSVMLRRNVGHQRAIAIGLCHVCEHLSCDAVLVMDADGEDRPADAVRLLEACWATEPHRLVFGQRGRRSEGVVFSAFYLLYRLLFRLLTGKPIRSGNFSAVPASALERVVGIAEIWNNFCSGVLRSRLPVGLLRCDRGRRLAGPARMTFLGLVSHGLSAIAVYVDVIGIRLMVTTGLITLLALLMAASAIVIRVGTDLAIPGWATYVVGLAAVILLQAITLSFFFVFLVLMSRNRMGSTPLREYEAFVLRVVGRGQGDGAGLEAGTGSDAGRGRDAGTTPGPMRAGRRPPPPS